ncbi:NAD(+) synthase [Longimicrobium terrae]|uniref:Glutamine-dependent NAD(+) synthetase n=1 Tax=Longimicrobium terrae TaxID=1639882 RepID=A0A841H137_9BACT|nr:NAD(+) synthase [Longimicrobium terrae]MBB4637111.1 NAD+ synthase (glutamine-hydrolyzing) [Longimicrobium terrae]MBB6071629.1 NAD+ synthase (glutamine-hydrolyzing) [Longimicrobium terrae]NNC29955.1 NAD(+) synthase [Longimicrobium terrae]
MRAPFHSIYSHGFVRVAVCIPSVRVADPAYNVEHTLGLARRASEQKAAVALFPELGISSYTCEDLFQQDALQEAVLAGIERLVAESAELTPVLLVGAPLRFQGRLFNCAVAIHRGRILGIVPKSYLPTYREFYETRWFTRGRDAAWDQVTVAGQTVPFGADILFEAENVPGFVLHTEVCEDVWTPIPPSTYAALAGATVIANLSASNITVGKAEYRRDLCATQSGRCICAYLYSAAGPGESTTDLAWDGHALIYEQNDLLAESPRFADEEHMIAADVDLERLLQERSRMNTFQDSAGDHADRVRAMRRIPFHFPVPAGDIALQRTVGRFPYVPDDAAVRDARCYEAYNIQVHGLMKRLAATGIKKIVIGVSGGLDSTQALIVAARTMDRLGLPRENILGYTMPGFATSSSTKGNAWDLMRGLGITAAEIDIRPSCLQMLRDIGHPFASGEPVYDVTFENVQAGERTSHLFRLANLHDGLVLGTGDLSELALGWATYGVGDHMSHYNVNASVPKTMIQYLIRWVIHSGQFNAETGQVLQRILDTEISPELVPGGEGESAQPAQSTQEKIGPYELQDFTLFYVTRFGFRPSKIAFLELHAWGDRESGGWPELLPAERRNQYDLATIKRWMEVFLWRFFKISQFKRSAVPNGPKVGSGGSLSPRGDWRAPSDSEATVWLDELRNAVP